MKRSLESYFKILEKGLLTVTWIYYKQEGSRGLNTCKYWHLFRDAEEIFDWFSSAKKKKVSHNDATDEDKKLLNSNVEHQVELQALEEVESLEERIASASLQVKVSIDKMSGMHKCSGQGQYR